MVIVKGVAAVIRMEIAPRLDELANSLNAVSKQVSVIKEGLHSAKTQMKRLTTEVSTVEDKGKNHETAAELLQQIAPSTVSRNWRRGKTARKTS